MGDGRISVRVHAHPVNCWFVYPPRGLRRPVTRTVIQVETASDEQVSYRIRNGWMNQDPFEFHRVDVRERV